MLIFSSFTDNGQPSEGLTPSIIVWEGDTDAVVVNGSSMTEVGSGLYKFDFTEDQTKTYSFRADGGVGLSALDRYTYNVSDISAGVTSMDSTIINEIQLGSDLNIYLADIHLTIDDVSSTDEYTVTWFKNGQIVTSNVGSPFIEVIKRADGTSLIPSTAMAEVASTGVLKYDEGTNRITDGEAVIAVVSTLLDSQTRTFSKIVSRDE